MHEECGRRVIGRYAEDEQGQSSVEYALVLFACIAVVVALGTMWHSVRDGILLRRSIDASSHSFASGFDLGATQDILLY